VRQPLQQDSETTYPVILSTEALPQAACNIDRLLGQLQEGWQDTRIWLWRRLQDIEGSLHTQCQLHHCSGWDHPTSRL